MWKTPKFGVSADSAVVINLKIDIKGLTLMPVRLFMLGNLYPDRV
jgi:hypothetical protein